MRWARGRGCRPAVAALSRDWETNVDPPSSSLPARLPPTDMPASRPDASVTKPATRCSPVMVQVTVQKGEPWLAAARDAGEPAAISPLGLQARELLFPTAPQCFSLRTAPQCLCFSATWGRAVAWSSDDGRRVGRAFSYAST